MVLLSLVLEMQEQDAILKCSFDAFPS